MLYQTKMRCLESIASFFKYFFKMYASRMNFQMDLKYIGMTETDSGIIDHYESTRRNVSIRREEPYIMVLLNSVKGDQIDISKYYMDDTECFKSLIKEKYKITNNYNVQGITSDLSVVVIMEIK